MSEVVKIVSNFAFKEFKLKRISAGVFSWNKASMGVLKKNGFKFEGILRKNANSKGKILDEYVFAKVK